MEEIFLNNISDKGLVLEYMGFSDGSAGKESARNAGDLGSIPESQRPHGEGKGYPFHYSCLENRQRSLTSYSH